MMMEEDSKGACPLSSSHRVLGVSILLVAVALGVLWSARGAAPSAKARFDPDLQPLTKYPDGRRFVPGHLVPFDLAGRHVTNFSLVGLDGAGDPIAVSPPCDLRSGTASCTVPQPSDASFLPRPFPRSSETVALWEGVPIDWPHEATMRLRLGTTGPVAVGTPVTATVTELPSPDATVFLVGMDRSHPHIPASPIAILVDCPAAGGVARCSFGAPSGYGTGRLVFMAESLDPHVSLPEGDLPEAPWPVVLPLASVIGAALVVRRRRVS